ncbi:MAG: hypothetical protein NVSMB64_31620 [Candidatus Velthaea sp.]
MSLFIRVTLGIAAVVVAFVIFAFVLKVLIFAALAAGLFVGGTLLVAAIRRRTSTRGGQVMTLTARR